MNINLPQEPLGHGMMVFRSGIPELPVLSSVGVVIVGDAISVLHALGFGLLL